MVYIFLLINALMVFGVVASEGITIGQSIGNVNKNAPWVVTNLYAFMSLITLIMVTAFVQSTALRDYKQKTNEIIFSCPIDKFSYLIGRFTGSTIIAALPILGVSLGILIGQLMPWVDSERLGPTYWMAHVNGFLMFGIPNTILIAAIIYAIATLTRSTIASFVGLIGILVGYSIAGNLMGDIENESMGMLLDPFAIGTYSTMTKYWTISDKNTLVLAWQLPLILNRLIWIGVGGLILLFAYMRFRFTVPRKSSKKKNISEEDMPNATQELGKLTPIPSVNLNFSGTSQWKLLLNQAWVDFLGVVKSVPFIIILLFGVFNLANSMTYANQWYGLTAYPVTYIVIDLIRGSMYMFTISLIVIYSGAVVWKERESDVAQIYDALPHPEWIPAISKLLAVLGMIAVLQIISILTGMVAQASFGYTQFEPGVYFTELLVIDYLSLVFISMVSMLVHTLLNNKYIAYFGITVVVILNFFIWGPLDIQTYMVRLGSLPSHTYSDMNQWGPYVSSLQWFSTYWMLFGGLLVLATILFWMRGLDTGWTQRLSQMKLRLNRPMVYWTSGILALWLMTAG
jgi:hypothetical protein